MTKLVCEVVLQHLILNSTFRFKFQLLNRFYLPH